MSSSTNWTIAELGDTVANPRMYAGGGAIAAMSLAGAAATTELVLRLTSKRKKLSSDTSESLGALAERALEWRETFLRDIDHDIETLTLLMNAMRARREAHKRGDAHAESESRANLDNAVRRAIESPLGTTLTGLELLEAILTCQEHASRFTVSDLGAAAATTNGAIVSMLLMADVNIDMLEDSVQEEQYRDEINHVRDRSREISETIVSNTWNAIRPDTDQGQT